MFRDGSTAITGRQQLLQGSWVHRVDAGVGTNGYWRICQIDITGVYCNQPIEITYTQRGNNQTCHLYIRFGSANNRTPALESLTYRGATSGAYSLTSGSTTSIYVKKSEAYDQLGILEFLKDSYNAFTVTWKNEFVSSLPSGYKTATQVFSPGTANTAQVLTGYTFSSANGVNLSGAMPNRGNLNWSGSNTTYSVPAGYYSGGTLDSRPSYNNGYNAGNSAGRSLKSRTYSAPETTSSYTWKNTGNGNDVYGHIQISLGLGTHTIVGAHWYNSNYSDSWILTCNGYMMRQNKKTFTRQDTGPTGGSWSTNNVLHLPSGGSGAHTIIVWYV